MSTHNEIAIAMIVARARNGVIGVGGKLPWHLPEDLRFFKRTTRHKPVVMGRATFESIGRPLPERTNIVVTRESAYQAQGVRVANSLQDALDIAIEQARLDGADEVMIIGGGEIYALGMPLADRLYVTQVDVAVEGDTFFPEIDTRQWQLQEQQQGESAAGMPDYRFLKYQRVK